MDRRLEALTRFEWLLVALFAGTIAFQSFVPPTVGLANNGDYEKLIGRYGLWPVDPSNPDEQIYYEQRWRYDRSHIWKADNYSSELLLIKIALAVDRLFDDQFFDLRILGAIHALLWVACFSCALPLFRNLPGWSRYAVPLLVAFVFSDVSYVAYFNSFHTDAAAFIFLAWTVVIALRLATDNEAGLISFCALIVTSLLFIAAKPQHSLDGILLWPVVAWIAWSLPQRRRKYAGLVLSCLLPVAAILTLRHVPDPERKVEMFNSIFGKVLPHSRSPGSDLRELGLSPGLQGWIGAYADQPVNNPMQNDEVSQSLTAHVHRRLAMFCVRHPWRTFEIIYADLGLPAERRRPPFLGNYQRKSGFPPKTLAHSFFWWSEMRSWLFRIARWHILVWYTLFAVGTCFWIWRHRRDRRVRVAIVYLVLAAQGVMALGFASLGDTGETDRHLLLFHFITDLTILMAFCWYAGQRGPASDRNYVPVFARRPNRL